MSGGEDGTLDRAGVAGARVLGLLAAACRPPDGTSGDADAPSGARAGESILHGIAEGSANDGIGVASLGDERLEFAREVPFPLAGLDPDRAAE